MTLDMTLRLLLTLAIGSAIGVERTLHGRPAGFRTRMAQGIMTGIGFSVPAPSSRRAFWCAGSPLASLWMTAAIGILVGMGIRGAALLAFDVLPRST